jgi:drug/metabolite transporter (DMT)-like permease
MAAFLAILVAQLLYTTADIFQKKALGNLGFSFRTFINPAFAFTFMISATGFVFQMYALSRMELSRAIILLGVIGVVTAAIAGILVFQDKFTWWNWLGVAFAITAIVLVKLK